MSFCTSVRYNWKDWSKSSPSVIFKHCGGGTASTWPWAHRVSGPISSSVLAQPQRSLTCSLTSAGEVSSNTPQIRQHLLQDVGSSCISKAPPPSASPIWQLNWEVRVSWSLLRKSSLMPSSLRQLDLSDSNPKISLIHLDNSKRKRF